MTEQPIRLTGPADLADAIPHLFGYQPTESLVLLYLTGPRHRYTCGACTPPAHPLPAAPAAAGPRRPAAHPLGQRHPPAATPTP